MCKLSFHNTRCINPCAHPLCTTPFASPPVWMRCGCGQDVVLMQSFTHFRLCQSAYICLGVTLRHFDFTRVILCLQKFVTKPTDWHRGFEFWPLLCIFDSSWKPFESSWSRIYMCRIPEQKEKTCRSVFWRILLLPRRWLVSSGVIRAQCDASLLTNCPHQQPKHRPSQKTPKTVKAIMIETF